jgi:serine/threonine protein kinase
MTKLSTCLSQQRIEECLQADGCFEQTEKEHLDQCTVCQARLEQWTVSEFLVSYRRIADAESSDWSFLSPQLRPGDLGAIDEFAIEGLIDSGGMGIVLRGWDTHLSRPVALKVLSDQHSNNAYARFEAETRALARLHHPHIVPVFSIGRTVDQRPYMVMPLIEGSTLRSQLTIGLLPPLVAAEFIKQVASGLDAAHNAGLIHRDIKPANIILDQSDGLAKIIDFGLVRAQHTTPLTRQDVLCGTPEYMSPEQASSDGMVDARSDVYSLGVTLYECLTGTPPFRGQPLEILEQHRACEPVPPTKINRQIPRDLETICLKAIAKDRDRRYATAQQMMQDVERFLTNRPILARPVSRIEKFRSWCKRNRPLAIALLLLIVVLLGGSITSTALWLRSQRAATVSAQMAQDLKHSRNRLRASVQKFQNRVFSDESLHWQMSKDFRAEMFRNVLDYLDEFSKLPSDKQQSDNQQSEHEFEDLIRSYLEVAQAALHVGDFPESMLAAERALALLHSPASVPAKVEVLIHRSQAARLLLLATLQTPSFQESVAQEYVTECLTASSAAVATAPGDVSAELNHMICVISIWGAGYDQESSAQQIVKMEKTQQRLTQIILAAPPSITEQARKSLAQLYWLLIPLAPAEQILELLKLADSNVTSYRELLRANQKPLLDSDRLRGGNDLLRARIHRSRGEMEDAILATESAATLFRKAGDLQPLNRIWREELASTQTQLSALYHEVKNFSKARDAINTAILNYVQTLETDPKDVLLRVRIIEALCRFGELSLLLDDDAGAYRGYYTAAQDCRLLMLPESVDQELANWAFHCRLKFLVKALIALDKSGSDADKTRTEEQVQTWLTHIRSNTSWNAEKTEQLIRTRELPELIDFPESVRKRLLNRDSHQGALRALMGEDASGAIFVD